MEGLTKEKAIELHRKLWNYIADESEKKGRIVTKEEAFIHFGWSPFVKAGCWCCEYVNKNINHDPTCSYCMHYCPIRFDGRENTGGTCLGSGDSSYICWEIARKSGNYKLAAEAARRIAELPERED